MEQQKWTGKLDDQLHSMIEAGYTDISIGSLHLESGGTMGPWKGRPLTLTIYGYKPGYNPDNALDRHAEQVIKENIGDPADIIAENFGKEK